MIHDRRPCRRHFQSTRARPVPFKERAASFIDVVARHTLQIMVGLGVFEQRKRNGYCVHAGFLKGPGDKIRLAVFLNAFEERVNDRVLITLPAHGPALAPIGDKKHLHQDARHARADENVEERFFHT
jgi:hypothetical protein